MNNMNSKFIHLSKIMDTSSYRITNYIYRVKLGEIATIGMK